MLGRRTLPFPFGSGERGIRGGRGRGCELHGFGLPERISVFGGGFRRSVDDGGEKLRHARIGESLENDFPPDAVRIALRDAYFVSVFRHK